MILPLIVRPLDASSKNEVSRPGDGEFCGIGHENDFPFCGFQRNQVAVQTVQLQCVELEIPERAGLHRNQSGADRYGADTQRVKVMQEFSPSVRMIASSRSSVSIIRTALRAITVIDAGQPVDSTGNAESCFEALFPMVISLRRGVAASRIPPSFRAFY